jgi:hypothetical protein
MESYNHIAPPALQMLRVSHQSAVPAHHVLARLHHLEKPTSHMVRRKTVALF